MAGRVRNHHNKNRPMQPLLDNDNRVTAYGLGRSRSDKGKGNWTNVHLNPYTNCIHTLVGGGWPTMQVFVVETYGEEDNV